MVRKGKEMKNLLLLVLGSTLLVSPSVAQSANDISIPEFRQTLTDYLTLTDEYRGTNYAPLLASVPDSTLTQWYTAVPDGRQFQRAVSSFKASMEARMHSAAARGLSKPAVAATPVPRHPTAAAESAQSSPFGPGIGASGIGSPAVPDYTLYTPNYPSGPNWSLMTGTLQDLGYLQSGDVSNQGCDANQEANLAQIVGVFKGIKDVADQICDAIPDPVVIVLGEGTRIPLKEICFGINLIVGAFNSAFDGFLADCGTQGDLVDGANAQATYYNSIGLYNLEFRLMVEENLGNTASPIGLFELPGYPVAGSPVVGYLDAARAIANDIITNMQLAGVNVASAQSALAVGDTNYNAKAYKQAFKQYQKAYGLAVQ
jgi:hypothetical protein